MKTSLIAFRVADFLKQYPPFQALSIEDLLPLAQSGRVAFHSEEEFVCRQGQPCKPAFWVIQQGGVELVDEATGAIADLLSAGDLFGVEPAAGQTRYAFSARTTCDVIVYALALAALDELRAKSSTVDQYLRALLGQPEGTGETTGWLPTPSGKGTLLAAHAVRLPPGAPLADVAAAMLAAGSQVAVITGDRDEPLGVVTDNVLRRALADRSSAASAVGEAMATGFPVVPRAYSLEESVMAMVRAREPFVVVTRDGTRGTPAEGVITETTIQLLSGASPSTLIRRTAHAESLAELSVLRERVYAFAASHLHDSASVPWFSEYLSAFLGALTGRVLALFPERLPPDGWCWLLFGPAGRSELLSPVAPSGAFLLRDGDAGLERFQRASAFVEEAYAACGLSSTPPLPPMTIGDRMTRLRRVVDAPLEEGIHRSRALFDFHAAAGDATVAAEYRAEMKALLREAGTAIALLGHDCLGSLPPLTLYQDLAVAMDGSRSSALDIAHTGLEPLADVGRVFALAAGDPFPAGTVDRLREAAARYPDHAALFHEAASAFRVLLRQQCRSGSVIYPAVLSRYDQLLLKNAFRGVLRVMEFTHAHAFSLQS